MDILSLMLAQYFGVTEIEVVGDKFPHRTGADCPCQPNVELCDCSPMCNRIKITHRRCDAGIDTDDRNRLVH